MAFTQAELDTLHLLGDREGAQAVIDATLEQQQKAKELAAFQTINALTALTVSDIPALIVALNDTATQSLTVERCLKGINTALVNGNVNRFCTWTMCLVAVAKGRFGL